MEFRDFAFEILKFTPYYNLFCKAVIGNAILAFNLI